MATSAAHSLTAHGETPSHISEEGNFPRITVYLPMGNLVLQSDLSDSTTEELSHSREFGARIYRKGRMVVGTR